ncbi:MAG: heavy metal translocating P-type ATPase [Schwartzia sp.]|nr:heavy metal translocating P-type ATPase [Schwartzia sp. (in: firmicutes)]
MKQYNVTGMTCAACSNRVEKAVSKVPGVSACSVSLLTNSMGVEGTASAADIIAAVEAAGYGAAVKGASKAQQGDLFADEAESLKDHETPVLKKRLLYSLGFLAVLLYISMGHMMLDLPLPGFLAGNPVGMGIVEMLLSGIIMVINQKFFVSGGKSLFGGAPNMDTLVALGSMAAFVYSFLTLLQMTTAQLAGDFGRTVFLMEGFYFESAAMIVTLITIGKMLEARSKGKTTDALKSLMKLAPQTATVIRGETEQTVPVGEVLIGDVFVVRPGETIPVDGIVLEGTSAVNQAALTGESIPVDKGPGDAVSSATLNQSGFLKCRAERVGKDTALAQIIQLVSDAAATKAPIAKMADRVSGVFVPIVIAVAVITTAVWLFVGAGTTSAVSHGIAVLVVSCPCALGLATPVAIMAGTGRAAKNGILFKTSEAAEMTGRTQIVAFDKTGTITRGEPRVTDILPADGISERELLEMAAALEAKSEHPLARAVMLRTEEDGINVEPVEDFKAVSGSGVEGFADGVKLIGGSRKFITSFTELSDELQAKAEGLADEGKTPLFFMKDRRLIGIIAVADVLKEDSREAIEQLKAMGIHVVMLTGDNRRTAEAVGRAAGVDEVIADVLPEGKEAVIRRLQESGKVAMVGDGINDAPALTRADVGIAVGTGTDIAIDAADVVIMKSRLLDVPAAIRLSRATLTNIKENLFWAFFYNVVGIPLAAGAWIPVFGWSLTPMFGAAAMSLSSVSVVTNALRLNFFNIYDSNGDKKRSVDISKTKKKEVHTMVKTMKIEGMMCGHCESRVKKALEALPGVSEAVADHAAGKATVTMAEEVADDVLRKAVEDQDYKVLGVE